MPLTSKEYRMIKTFLSTMETKFLDDLISRKKVLEILKEFVKEEIENGQENTASSKNGDKEHK